MHPGLEVLAYGDMAFAIATTLGGTQQIQSLIVARQILGLKRDQLK